MGISFRAYQEKVGIHQYPWQLKELVRLYNVTGDRFKIKVDGEEYGITINKLSK